MITDESLNRMIAEYETRDPSRWHGNDLPAATLEVLEEFRALREKVEELKDVLKD